MKQVFEGKDYRLFYDGDGCPKDGHLIGEIVIGTMVDPSLKNLKDEIIIDMHLKYNNKYSQDGDDEIRDFVDHISQCSVKGLYIDKGDGNRQKFLEDYEIQTNGGFCKIVLKVKQEVLNG